MSALGDKSAILRIFPTLQLADPLKREDIEALGRRSEQPTVGFICKV
jgi:hypothetical protein